MVLPGPEAQQLATYIGWLMHGVLMHGVWGGIVAGVLFVLPSLFILIGLTWIYMVYGDVAVVAGVLYGIKPAVTAIVVYAAYRIGSKALKNNVLRTMAVLAFISIYFFKVPFPMIVIMAGIIAYIGSRYVAGIFQLGSLHSGSNKSYGPAIIDDDTPVPEHARFKWSRFILFLSVGLALWAGMILLLMQAYGWQGTPTQMGWFFTKAALFTIGGAYAVFPYVKDGAVEYYNWLSKTEMMDGMALGETTPGPLIMVVAFVGFVSAWNTQSFATDMLPLAGILGACVVTFFTFLPSFLFILLGGPAVEATRHDVKFTAPLTGITAAVVGVIFNLAVYFAYHTLWPKGFDGRFEWVAAFIGVVAFVALTRFKVGIIPVIGGCAAAGLVYAFF